MRNFKDLGSVFLESSMRVRNFAGHFRVIFFINKLHLYYYKCPLIRNIQDLRNGFTKFSIRE